jgi:uncharacterized membrane protein
MARQNCLEFPAMPYAASYFAALVFFLAVDIAWITTVMRPIFERNVGALLLETPRMGAAAGFYALYVAGLLYFAVAPAVSAETWRVAALNGAIIGFLAYGTYEATNLATLKGWSYEMLQGDSQAGRDGAGFIHGVRRRARDEEGAINRLAGFGGFAFCRGVFGVWWQGG